MPEEETMTQWSPGTVQLQTWYGIMTGLTEFWPLPPYGDPLEWITYWTASGEFACGLAVSDSVISSGTCTARAWFEFPGQDKAESWYQSIAWAAAGIPLIGTAEMNWYTTIGPRS